MQRVEVRHFSPLFQILTDVMSLVRRLALHARTGYAKTRQMQALRCDMSHQRVLLRLFYIGAAR